MATLFSKPKMPTIPEPQPAAPMPDENSPAVIEARRRSQLDVMRRAGRSSTILTDRNNDGGYSGSVLG